MQYGVLDMLWLIPALPLAGFALLVFFGRRLGRTSAVVGVGAVGLSAVLAIAIAVAFVNDQGIESTLAHASGSVTASSHASDTGNPQSAIHNQQFIQTLWTWMPAGNLHIDAVLALDGLSVLMILVVTFVAFLILLYSSQYMAGDDGYGRFFAYMNLFVAAMVILVLAGNLVLLYLGWEGVGLCSFLLIGFWYKVPANAAAARKAFIVTRVGDTAMMIGLLLLFTQLGTLEIRHVLSDARSAWPAGTFWPTLAAALLLGGALGKSAQLPLQTWLPDAMAGPTPVSALIHAATMVTAGVYLIARMYPLFELAPAVLMAVSIIGAVTLVVAGCSALVQRDIKRVLAYSTISQIGYMFLALGVGATTAAMFHFMTHAFFKSLLFLGAGAVILAMHEEHDMFKMGGLRRQMPIVFWTFLTGCASLSALPLITAGFYSKDLILSAAWSAPLASAWLWAAGVFGALITSIYAFRMLLVTFGGPQRHELGHRAGWRMLLPLVILALLSIVAGLVQNPEGLGHLTVIHNLLGAAARETGVEESLTLQWIGPIVSVLGVVIAWWVFGRASGKVRRGAERQAAVREPSQMVGSVREFWKGGWEFDWLYDRLFVRPVMWIARVNRGDIIDSIFDGIAGTARALHWSLSLTQNGRLRWYFAGIVAAATAAILIVVVT